MAHTVYISFRYTPERNLIWHIQFTFLFMPECNLIWYVQLTVLSLYARIQFDMARTVYSSFLYMTSGNYIFHLAAALTNSAFCRTVCSYVLYYCHNKRQFFPYPTSTSLSL